MRPFKVTSLSIALLVNFSLLFSNPLPQIQLPKKFTPKQDLTGWVMSEKLDGIRAIWNGKKLLSKNGNNLHPPRSFIKNFPPFMLDGELYSPELSFEKIQSIVLQDLPNPQWRLLKYNLFEVPKAKGDFYSRMKKAKLWFENHPNSTIYFISQHPCMNHSNVTHFFNKIVKDRGEGIILKNALLPYFSGRNSAIQKRKPIWDMEGEVIKINPGKGKFKGMMGSVTLHLKNNITFNLGSGFNLQERQNPPRIGNTITFRYHALSKRGKPKFASFLRIRKEE